MATFWVSKAAGDDADDGTTFALAKKTLPAAIALLTTKGDILNVVNDGDHDWPTAETTLPSGTIGTTFSDFGTLIRGTTTLGAAAQATIKPLDADGDVIRAFVRVVADTGYLILRNLTFDGTGRASDTSIYRVGRLRDTGTPDPGPIRYEGIALLGGTTGVAPTGARQMFAIHSTAPPAGTEIFQVEDCYFQNVGITTLGGGATLVKSIVGSIFYNDVAAAGTAIIAQTLAAGSGGTYTFNNNTLYQSIGNNVFGVPMIYSVAAGLDAGIVNVKDNLIFANSTNASPNVTLFGDTIGGAAATATDDIDFNVLLGGPDVVIGDLAAQGWYENLWDVSPPNDQEAYSQVEATVFTDPTSTFAWDALGNSVTITILKDLRPILFTTASSSGGVVGALPGGQTDLSVTNTASRTNPEPSDTVVFTIVAANTGVNDTNVAVTALLPAGLTFVSSTETTGTYASGTGIWTIGNLANAASETLTVTATVDTGQGGNTINYTATIAGDLDESASADNTATATLSIFDDTDVENPDSMAAVPVIDTFPIFARDLKLKLNMRLQTLHNRQRRFYLRRDVESQRWREFSTKRITLATNVTQEVNLGGVQRGQFLFLLATQPVQLSLSNSATNIYWPNSTVLVLSDGDFEKVFLKNTSTTVSTTVFIGVAD